MVKNASESCTTVKEMYDKMPSDVWSIERGLYRCAYEDASVVQYTMLLDKYQNYLSQYLVEVDVDPKYYYCPSMFAEDYYGDPGLDYLVLYFANITTLFDFDKPKIKVLDAKNIRDINSIYTRYKEDIRDSKSNPPSYTTADAESESSSADYIAK